MNLIDIKHSDSSEDEKSDASFDESQSSDGNEVMSEHPQTADSEASDEEMAEGKTHPYPTPPPDADVVMPLRKADKTIPIAGLKASSMEEAMDNKMASQNNKMSIHSRSLAAIRALNNRSGSSVVAIVKYIKSTGYEVSVEQRLPKLVLRALKRALAKGEVVQVKRSFKMSPQSQKSSKAMDKMKAKQKKEKQTAKQVKKQLLVKAKKAAAAPETSESVVKPKMKASERKTNAPVKKKPTQKLAAAAASAKAAAGLKAQESLEKSKKPVPKAKPAKVAKAAPDLAASSKPMAKATSKAPRKSIGTLISTSKQKSKPQTKLIRKMVAGKETAESEDNFESDFQPISPPTHSTPFPSSPSITSAKPKRKGRLMK